MNKRDPVIMKQFLLLAAGILFFISCPAQKSSEDAADNIKALLFSFDYASNTNVFENINNNVKQPSFSPSLSYLSSHVDLMLAGNLTANSDDSLSQYTSELDLMGGYNIKLTKNLTLYPSASYFIYGRNTHSLRSMFRSDIRIDIDYNYKFFNAGFSGGYLLGKHHTFYAAVRNYYQINFDRFLFKDASLSLLPGIDANFGSYEYLNLYYLDQLRQYPAFYNLLMRSPAIFRYVRRQQLLNPELTKEEIIDALLEEKADDSFSLTSINLYLPFNYMIGTLSLNAGIIACIPVNQPDYLSDDVIFYVNFGISYMLDIGSK